MFLSFPIKTSKKEWFVLHFGAQGGSYRFSMPACPFQACLQDLPLLNVMFRRSHGNKRMYKDYSGVTG